MNKSIIAGLAGLSLIATSSTRLPQEPQKRYASESYMPYFEPPSADVSPNPVTQGQVSFINVKTKHHFEKPYYLFNGKAFPLFREKEPYKDEYIQYTGLFPTTPDYKEGKYKIVVSDSTKNIFKEFHDTLEIEVKNGNFAPQKLSFPKGGKGGLTPKELEIKQAERSFVIKALNSVTYDDYYQKPPYKIPTKGPMTTEYGAMRPSFHNGLDVSAPTGQPIKSILDGKVLCARQQKYTGNGGIVIIDHGRFKSVFLHMSGFNVKEGDTIKQGQIIGKVGNTGISTASHMHFGIYVNGIPVDPEVWLDELAKDKSVVKRLLQQSKDIARKSLNEEISMDAVTKFLKTSAKIK